jgi:two-component system sensor histidine kinase VicK
MNIKLEKVNLPELLEDTLSFARDSNTTHGFITNVEPDLPEITVDRDKFSQIIGNLVSNAVKYSPGGGDITLSAHKDNGGRRLVVSVADHGLGIAPGDRDSLFSTFHRIQRPETQGIKGIGLGLYIAKEWTEAMGGSIWLDSELNEGSTFYVGIPIRNSNVSP